MATTASVAIAPPAPLEQKGNLGDNWRKWRQNFEIYMIASGIDQKDDKVTRAHFLHTIGQYGRDIYNDLDCSEEDLTLEGLFSRFENFCNPKTNLTFNRYQFFTTKQEKNQQFDKFLLALKQKGKNCEFGDLNNSLIMTQIISGITNTRLRERLLRIPDLDLNRTMEECRSTEISEAQAQEIAAATTTSKSKTKSSEKKQGKQAQPSAASAPKPAEGKKQRKQQKNDNLKSQQQQPKENATETKKVEQQTPIVMVNCLFCGKSHIYGKCPAFGSTCVKCQKPNHFAKVCKN